MAEGGGQAMKIYLINLDRSPERLARMTGVFADLGLEFTRVPAVDGDQLPVGTGSPIPSRPGLFYQLGAGETACFLSHRICWQAAVSSEVKYSAIFEDDAHLADVAGDLLRQSNWIPPDADIIKLETTLVRTFFDRKSTCEIGGRSVRRLRGAHAGACGYIITREAARKLIDASVGFVDPVDQFIFNSSSQVWAAMKIYQLAPAVCIQDMFVEGGLVVSGFESTLGSERPSAQRLGRIEKLLKEIARPVGRLGTKLVSTIRGHEWKRVPFR
ncbi:glycosyltransferase family 25 protein [Aminobacter aminovorans]|uniref:glycosyltransferase family 25 protein n=1 Tax=Aminobacter aminovorans TaxID=83263 RepID=UPI00285C9EF3|nr:glycosyltransferase family 25 protein [Aminobacter aminovorans]MDR7219756.1 glycosyl transferase family 25 [Aminobacter aminovorans]